MKKILVLVMSLLMVLCLCGCQTTQEKAEKHLSNKEFLKAYELALITEEKQLIDRVIITWQKEILETEVIDEEFKELEIKESKNLKLFAENILNYMYEKEKLDNKQLELVQALFDGIKNIEWGINLVKNVFNVLKSYSNDEKIWFIEERNPVSYEEYFSKEHIYTEESETKINNTKDTVVNEIVFDEYGMAVNVVYEDNTAKKQYVLFGDYTNYNYLASDGYWVYCFYGKDLLRISIEGEKETLYTFAEDITSSMSNEDYLTYFKFIDYDIALFKEVKDDILYIHRLYLPEKKLDTFKTKLIGDQHSWFGFGNWIIIKYDYFGTSRDSHDIKPQTSSNQILFFAVNPEYLNKVKKLKENPDLCYKLYKKYLSVNSEEEMKQEMAEAFENPVDYNSSGVQKLIWIIENEYKINKQANYNLNVLTGEIKISYVAPVINPEGFAK